MNAGRSEQGSAVCRPGVIATYARPDNPLLIPESQVGAYFGRFFYALGSGAIGFAPFGIDDAIQVNEPGVTDFIPAGGTRLTVPSESYTLLAPIGPLVANLTASQGSR